LLSSFLYLLPQSDQNPYYLLPTSLLNQLFAKRNKERDGGRPFFDKAMSYSLVMEGQMSLLYSL
jgi:hypothetical protein